MAAVLAAVEDLFFGAKIQATAARLEVPLALAPSPEALLAMARAEPPILLLLELRGEATRALEVIRALKTDPALRSVRVVAFYSHVQDELRRAAAAAGCDRILPRSAFARDLADLLRLGAPSGGGSSAEPEQTQG
jgi:CheY-like chemotaxis protein